MTWLQRREREQAQLGHVEQPYVVIVGGGQAGIVLGARLRRMGVPTIILERNARPGDSWRNRYDSLTLHDTVWFDHLPYIPFPAHWPVYTPKDQMGDWLEMYAKVMELNYWGGTECISARYDEDAASGPSPPGVRGSPSSFVRSSWCWQPGCRAFRMSPTSPVPTRSRATYSTRADPVRRRVSGPALRRPGIEQLRP